MATHVEDVMTRPAIFIDPDATVSHAATLMRRRHIRSLVVAVEGNDYGIITTTDIRDKIVGEDLDPKDTRVREIMSTPVVMARMDWTLKKASIAMKEAGIRHLPVIDDRGHIIGMVSAVDIFMSVEEAGWG